MKNIAEFDKIIAKNSYVDTSEWQLFKAYESSKEYCKDILDFDDYIIEDDIPDTVTAMRKYGVEQFAISSSFSGIVDTIAIFVKNGCKLTGVTTVVKHTKYDGDKKLNAFLLTV